MKTNGASILVKTLFVFLFFTGLHFAKDILIPFALATMLAMIFLPICTWLEKKRIHKAIAPLICIVLFMLVFAGIGSMIAWQISELSTDAVSIEKRILEITNGIKESVFEYSGISGAEQSKLISDQKSIFADLFLNLLGSITSIITKTLLMLVYVYLLLLYRNHIFEFILKLSHTNDKENNIKDLLKNAVSITQQYLIGLTKMIMLLWVMYSIGFYIAGVKNPIFFAIICGMLEIIPFIGNITGTAITILTSVLQGGSPGMVFGIVLAYSIIQLIQGWILEPLILGPQVKINPLFTILALVIGETIWGIPGIILAIPLTGMFKIVCDHVEVLKPYGFLIGEIKSSPVENKIIKKVKDLIK